MDTRSVRELISGAEYALEVLGDPTRALMLLVGALNTTTNHDEKADILTRIGNVYWHMKNYPESAKLWQEVLEMQDVSKFVKARAKAHMVSFCIHEGEYERAINLATIAYYTIVDSPSSQDKSWFASRVVKALRASMNSSNYKEVKRQMTWWCKFEGYHLQSLLSIYHGGIPHIDVWRAIYYRDLASLSPFSWLVNFPKAVAIVFSSGLSLHTKKFRKKV